MVTYDLQHLRVKHLENRSEGEQREYRMKILQLGLAAAILAGLAATFLYITGLTTIDKRSLISDEDIKALETLQTSFRQCVRANGLGMQAVSKDHCWVTLKFPSDTIPKWKDPKSGDLEGLSYDFNLCEALATWEQVRNSTTILTREYIDALPHGWEDYAWRRINKGILLDRCRNKTLCMEKLALVLPEMPPFVPRQFGRCAVIGNSGDLLKTKFGEDIDSYDAVIRGNGAPIEEVPIPNPVYLMLGMSFGNSAKGTGVKALEFALSVCDSVDIYGFTVDPGYTEWTRYFSESRQGHTPLQGRAYYQMMECLGLIKIHSPMRAAPDRVVKNMPGKSIIYAARISSEKVLSKAALGSGDPLRACAIWKRRSNEVLSKSLSLRNAAVEHQLYVQGVTLYPLEHKSSNEMLCIRPKA